MIQATRKTVEVEVEDIELDCINAGEAVALFENIVKRHGASAKISKQSYQYTDGQYLAVFIDRDETDEEMNARIKKEEYYESCRVERDRKEFERLSAQFKTVV